MEMANSEKFIDMHFEHFQSGRTHHPEKVRAVLPTTDKAENEDIAAELKKAEYRRINNMNSKECRLKKKAERTKNTLMNIFLQDRIASYEKRIKKSFEVIQIEKEAK